MKFLYVEANRYNVSNSTELTSSHSCVIYVSQVDIFIGDKSQTNLVQGLLHGRKILPTTQTIQTNWIDHFGITTEENGVC